MKHYAYWEMTAIGWQLVVYHNDKPTKSSQGADPERIGPWEVPQELIEIDGSPMLGLIARAFPKPEPKEES